MTCKGIAKSGDNIAHFCEFFKMKGPFNQGYFYNFSSNIKQMVTSYNGGS